MTKFLLMREVAKLRLLKMKHHLIWKLMLQTKQMLVRQVRPVRWVG